MVELSVKSMFSEDHENLGIICILLKVHRMWLADIADRGGITWKQNEAKHTFLRDTNSVWWINVCTCITTHTHTRLTALCPGLPGWASTRKVKPVWILVKQETMSGSGISWAICKSAPHSRQITMPAPHHSFFYRLDALHVTQPTVSMSKHWRQ